MIIIFLKNILFELNIRKRQISTYVYFTLFLFLGLVSILSAGGAFNGAVLVGFSFANKVLINSPASLYIYISLLGSFSLFIMAPIFGQAIYKDYGANIDQIIFSTSVNRKSFLLGRFFGAFLTLLIILSGIGIGIWIATLLPIVQKSLFGSNQIKSYLIPYLTGIIPNIFIFGSIFFLLASKTKKMIPVYVAGILIFMSWMLAGQLTSDLDNKMLSALIEPFGINAIFTSIRYWSADAQNTQYITLSGYYLYNRLFWITIGLICLSWSLLTFKESQKVKINSKPKETTDKNMTPKEDSFSFITPDFSLLSQIHMFFKQIKFELSQTLKSIYFRVILFAGIIYIFIVSNQIGKFYGVITYPVTYKILDIMGGNFDLFILIILTFYAGETIWRERDNRIDQVIDAFPTPSWVFIATKYLSLLVLTAILLLVLIICGVIAQTFKGYTYYELDLYFKHLFLIKFITFMNIAALAFFLQTILNNKYLGHGVMIIYYILYTWMSAMGFEHKIYRFNAAPLPAYSDMNMYGRFLEGYFTFKLYWLTISILMLMVVFLFWQRGILTDWKKRLIECRRRFKTNHIMTSLVLVFITISLGSIILYNTNHLNHFKTTAEKEANNYEYEKKYKQYKFHPRLNIISVKASIDIFPRQARIKSKIHYRFKNKSNLPIQKIFLNIPPGLNPYFEWSVPAKQTVNDKALGVVFYSFEKEISPKQELDLFYSIDIDRSSFPNGAPDINIATNGTFFNSWSYFPTIGYNTDKELSETKTRIKYGLKEKRKLPNINNKQAHFISPMNNVGDLISFEAIISTSLDQYAITSGQLIKRWKKNNRHYFHYKASKKIRNGYSFQSSSYKIRKDKWDNIDIGIYYHPNHDRNIDRMIEATKMSLDYFTKNFGPYQYQQVKIIEFPRYHGQYAISFPDTIPFSESIGFIAKIDGNKDFDYVFYVTSHELAHQWWGHQLMGANVQGVTMITESFAQYSALMVMEKKYGKRKMRKFLRYELDRYLHGRSKEKKRELPLYINEHQGYIHYRKGSLIMYALKDYIGENIVNSALKTYIKRAAFQEAPFTTSIEFLKILKSKTTPEHYSLIDDMFKKIVLFENKPLTARYKKMADNSYQVSIKISSKKYYVDEGGKEQEAKFSQPMYIGIKDRKGNFLYLEKQKIHNGENKIVVNVKEHPYKASIDPLNILVDKNPDDNQINISEQM